MTTDPTRAPATWWSDRWAWRGALGAAPLGALVAILHALLVQRAPFDEALVAYLIGAMVAAGIGCVVLGPLGGTVATHRFRREQRLSALVDDDVYPDEVHPGEVHGAEQRSAAEIPEPTRHQDGVAASAAESAAASERVHSAA
jgi:hypothetical protein